MGFAGPAPLLVDGEPVRSCITFAGACGGADVTTIEGLDNDEIAVELRAAFNREHALQCGFCTPGMLVSARDLVRRLPEPDERRIRLGLSGNLCRCTGYVGIVRAVRSVIAARRERGIAPIVADPERGLGPVGARIGSGLATGAPAPKTARAARSPAGCESRRAVHPDRQFRADFHDWPAPGGGVRCIWPHPRDRGLHSRRGARQRAGPESGRGRHSRQIRADLAGLPRVGPRSNATRTTWPGESSGAGADAGQRSTMQGEIRYRVVAGEAPGTARVELAIGYALKGALAQFGRPSLVRNLAGRMIAEFSRNLEDRLTGRSSEAAPASINLPRLVLAIA